jgi:chromosome segregation ATPase
MSVYALRLLTFAGQAEKRNVHDSARQHQDSLNLLEAKIEEEHRKVDESSGGANKRIAEDIGRLQESNASLQAQSVSVQYEIDQLELQRSDGAGHLMEAREGSEQARRDVTDIQGRIMSLQRQKNNEILAYGDKVPEILRAIERESWDSKPLGPIGLYVHLTEPRWAQALESIFGPLLNAFVVTTNNDKRKLMNLTKRLNAT